MAGHYLATENPEVAAELSNGIQASGIAPEPLYPLVDERALPDIGTVVVYIARPGEGRSGKQEFPAMVMHHEQMGGLYLLVLYDYDDQVCRPNVYEATEDMPWPAWRHVRNGQIVVEEPFEPTRLNIMRKDVDQLRADLDRMLMGIYGKYKIPANGIMSFLVAFEAKLKEISKRVSAIEK